MWNLACSSLWEDADSLPAVLVVEDDADIRKLLCLAYEAGGYTTQTDLVLKHGPARCLIVRPSASVWESSGYGSATDTADMWTPCLGEHLPANLHLDPVLALQVAVAG